MNYPTEEEEFELMYEEEMEMLNDEGIFKYFYNQTLFFSKKKHQTSYRSNDKSSTHQ